MKRSLISIILVIGLLFAITLGAFGQSLLPITIGEKLFGLTKATTTIGLDYEWMRLTGFITEGNLHLYADIPLTISKESDSSIQMRAYFGGGAAVSLDEFSIYLKGLLGFEGQYIDKLRLYGDGIVEWSEGKFQLIPSVGLEANTRFFLDLVFGKPTERGGENNA